MAIDHVYQMITLTHMCTPIQSSPALACPLPALPNAGSTTTPPSPLLSEGMHATAHAKRASMPSEE